MIPNTGTCTCITCMQYQPTRTHTLPVPCMTFAGVKCSWRMLAYIVHCICGCIGWHNNCANATHSGFLGFPLSDHQTNCPVQCINLHDSCPQTKQSLSTLSSSRRRFWIYIWTVMRLCLHMNASTFPH